MNWIKLLFGKKTETKQCDIDVVSESFNGFTIKNSTFIQTDLPIDKTEEKLTPSSGDVFDNCIFHVRRGRAALNFR